MTKEEVEKYFDQNIKISCPGIVKGWKEVRIIDYDFSKQTPNGKGIVKYENVDRDASDVVCALSQIELYENPKKKSRRRK